MFKRKSQIFIAIFALAGVIFGFNHNHTSAHGTFPQGSGIVFFSTQKLDQLKEFYTHRLGCKVWLDQGACILLRYGNLLVGFCESNRMDKDGLITFFFKTKADVDKAYAELKDIAISPPKENKKYSIYHFYAKDPEGRSIEFQYFMHPIDWDFQAD